MKWNERGTYDCVLFYLLRHFFQVYVLENDVLMNMKILRSYTFLIILIILVLTLLFTLSRCRTSRQEVTEPIKFNSDDHNTKLVIILTEARSGSTWLGTIFQQVIQWKIQLDL